MKKALAKNIKTAQLLEIIKKFEGIEFVDVEVFEFDNDEPSKIIIRTSKQEDKQDEFEQTKTESIKNDEVSKDDSNIQNPKLSENISYKDLLDNLN